MGRKAPCSPLASQTGEVHREQGYAAASNTRSLRGNFPMSALFGILQLDKGAPNGYAQIPGLLQSWLQDAGGFAAVGTGRVSALRDFHPHRQVAVRKAPRAGVAVDAPDGGDFTRLLCDLLCHADT